MLCQETQVRPCWCCRWHADSELDSTLHQQNTVSNACPPVTHCAVWLLTSTLQTAGCKHSICGLQTNVAHLLILNFSNCSATWKTRSKLLLGSFVGRGST